MASERGHVSVEPKSGGSFGIAADRASPDARRTRSDRARMAGLVCDVCGYCPGIRVPAECPACGSDASHFQVLR